MLAEEGEPGPDETHEVNEASQQHRDVGRSKHINEQAVSFVFCQVERLVNDCVVEHEQWAVFAPGVFRSVHDDIGPLTWRRADVVQDSDPCSQPTEVLARLGLGVERGNADGLDVLEFLLELTAACSRVVEPIPLVDQHRSFVRLPATMYFRDDLFDRTAFGDLPNLFLVRLREIGQLVNLLVDERQAEDVDQGVHWAESPGQSSVDQKEVVSDRGAVSAVAKNFVDAAGQIHHREGRIDHSDDEQRRSSLQDFLGIPPGIAQRFFRWFSNRCRGEQRRDLLIQ